MGVALSRHDVTNYLPTNATSSAMLYGSSATPYTSFESGFISVCSLSIARVNKWLELRLFVGNCCSGFLFGIIGGITNFCELDCLSQTRELDLTLPQINVIHPPSRLGDHTHIPIIFGSLIVSNLLQSIGTIFNIRWVSLGSVSPGTLCSLQGASAPTNVA